MSDGIFDILITYGMFGVFICAFLSCLLIPVPTSLLMLAGGALVAAGDVSALSIVLPAFLGAVMGDQTGYFIGRKAGQVILPRLKQHPKRAKIIINAEKTVEKRGGIGVFFSTWLFAPLGPYVNIAAGAAGLPWLRFTFFDVMGEAIWVSAYVGIGYIFAESLSDVSAVIGNVIGLVVALGVAAASATWIAFTLRAQKAAELKEDDILDADVLV